MGYLFKDTCYPTQAAARIAECASAHTVVLSGTTVYTSQCNSSSVLGTSYTLCLRTNGGACTARTVTVQPDIPCAYDPAVVNQDLLSLFGLALGAAVAVLAVKWLYHYFKPDRNHEP